MQSRSRGGIVAVQVRERMESTSRGTSEVTSTPCAEVGQPHGAFVDHASNQPLVGSRNLGSAGTGRLRVGSTGQAAVSTISVQARNIDETSSVIIGYTNVNPIHTKKAHEQQQ